MADAAGDRAVLNLVGHVKGSPPTLRTDATRNVIAAMEQLGIRRLASADGAPGQGRRERRMGRHHRAHGGPRDDVTDVLLEQLRDPALVRRMPFLT
ncbi:MAG: hypothetical protein WC580_00360 [Agrococcus sp.]